jgi:outer membrane beta-barrel protein
MRTTMMRRALKGLLVTFLATGAIAATASEASAQEIQLTGPLRGQPPVRRLRQYRAGRFEIAPTMSFSLLDEYRHAILAGARLQYNLTDWLGIGVWGAYNVVNTTTDLTDQIQGIYPDNKARDPRVALNVGPNFPNQTANITYVAAPQLTAVPFRGKLAIFNKVFVDTDFYVSGGVAFVGLNEREDCTSSATKDCSKDFNMASRTAISPTLGIGLTFYTNDWISLGVEYRALPFSWNRAGFDSRGSGTNNKFPDGNIDKQDQTFKWNQMITIAVGFSLPAKPHVSE